MKLSDVPKLAHEVTNRKEDLPLWLYARAVLGNKQSKEPKTLMDANDLYIIDADDKLITARR